MYLKKYKNKNAFDLIKVLSEPRSNHAWEINYPIVLAFKNKGYLLKKKSGTQTIEEFSKAHFPERNQKGTEAKNGMMRLLSLGHLSFRIRSKPH